MIRNRFRMLIITFISINFIMTGVFAVELHSLRTDLHDLKKTVNNNILYAATISRIPIPLEITYIKPTGKEAYIQTFDNTINVGNEAINESLTEFFLLHRKHNLLSASNPIPVRISEKENKASVIVNLPESAVMFDIPLK